MGPGASVFVALETMNTTVVPTNASVVPNTTFVPATTMIPATPAPLPPEYFSVYSTVQPLSLLNPVVVKAVTSDSEINGEGLQGGTIMAICTAIVIVVGFVLTFLMYQRNWKALQAQRRRLMELQAAALKDELRRRSESTSSPPSPTRRDFSPTPEFLDSGRDPSSGDLAPRMYSSNGTPPANPFEDDDPPVRQAYSANFSTYQPYAKQRVDPRYVQSILDEDGDL